MKKDRIIFLGTILAGIILILPGLRKNNNTQQAALCVSLLSANLKKQLKL
jgi:hypothetical protein